MKYSFHPQAEDELNVAIDYYEECHKGLGLEFAMKFIKRYKEYVYFQMLGRF